jgi:methylated-DNA-[protein]-cysteine S-methyltransferase
MIHTSAIDTPLGAMTAAVKDEALIGLWFVGQRYYPTLTDQWIAEPDHPIFEPLRHHLACYFAGKPNEIGIRLAPSGTHFQKTVWDILLKIPMGQIATYGQIAKQIAENRLLPSMSAQAVGSAVGHNPISIIIPCHRVVASDGSLTGYAGGLDRKAELLRIEKANMTSMISRINPDSNRHCRIIEERGDLS